MIWRNQYDQSQLQLVQGSAVRGALVRPVSAGKIVAGVAHFMTWMRVVPATHTRAKAKVLGLYGLPSVPYRRGTSSSADDTSSPVAVPVYGARRSEGIGGRA